MVIIEMGVVKVVVKVYLKLVGKFIGNVICVFIFNVLLVILNLNFKILVDCIVVNEFLCDIVLFLKF